MSKEKVFLFLQNKELQKILDETKRQLEEFKNNQVNKNIDEDSETSIKDDGETKNRMILK